MTDLTVDEDEARSPWKRIVAILCVVGLVICLGHIEGRTRRSSASLQLLFLLVEVLVQLANDHEAPP